MDGTPAETLHPLKLTYNPQKQMMAFFVSRSFLFPNHRIFSFHRGHHITNPNFMHYKENPCSPYICMIFDPKMIPPQNGSLVPRLGVSWPQPHWRATPREHIPRLVPWALQSLLLQSSRPRCLEKTPRANQNDPGIIFPKTTSKSTKKSIREGSSRI